ncbi:ABC transporter substrate-binding protein [Saliterribacillus persicus]|uniref:Carbohydrate ABC transporter substrate-binding protein (CUT1 family) n=1 Tax=Saliterribacillus persicus TaxID=930114 RepID=A0A368Y608_9BACI|nr:ABC transporter substrate-binding protein [Saliterribacillus persicus]RCW74768.1 carbohydrate ABC transporter substrate-binding protein (CUT1 family) [Saliterribacillus persicus]
MKSTKLALSLFILFLLGAFLVGCSNESENTSTEGEGEGEEYSAENPLTLSFYSEDGAEKSFDDPVAQAITEKTGIKLDMQYPVGGNEETVPLMIASGDYPDLIFAKGDISKLIEAGGVIKLDDLIEEKGDNLKAMYGDQLDCLRNTIDDPSIYTVGTYGVEGAYWSTSGSFQIQLDVLRELGYPEIKTLEDFEAALTEYYEKYPEIDGQKTLPLSLLGSDWRWLITVGDPAAAVAGIPGDGQWAINDDTGEATYKFLLPELKEYFKWLNGMNDKGLLDSESFTHTYDTYISKLSSGRVLSIADQDWNIGDADKALVADGKEWRTYAPLPVTLGEEYVSQGLKDYGFAGGWGIAISSTSEHQEEAFEFLDWMASEEAQILTNWGIEGENYDIVDGERVMKEEDRERMNNDPDYSKETGVGYYVYPFPQWGNGAVDSNGQPITPNSEEDIINNFNTAEKEVLEEYQMENWIDWFPPTEELGVSNHGQAFNYSIQSGSELEIIQQKADDLTEQRITQAILGDPAEFDAAWESMIEELEAMNIEKANEEMTQKTKDVMELWGTN